LATNKHCEATHYFIPSQPSVPFFRIYSNISFSALLAQSLKYFLNAAETVPHPHKTTRKLLSSITLKTQFSELIDSKKFLNILLCISWTMLFFNLFQIWRIF